MKSLQDYTIYCTEAQMKKALELGAPIGKKTIEYSVCPQPGSGYEEYFLEETDELIIPTAEQMVGWLEDSEEIDEIAPIKTGKNWDYVIYMTSSLPDIENLNGTFPTRREALLAAIDAALDYLEKEGGEE